MLIVLLVSNFFLEEFKLDTYIFCISLELRVFYKGNNDLVIIIEGYYIRNIV